MNMLTGESQIVSKAMMATSPLETHTDLFWDGFFACCEGQPLSAMPTETHEFGWWSANMNQAEVKLSVNGIDVTAELADLQEDMADRHFWAQGGW